jgi:hypothetical protein
VNKLKYTSREKPNKYLVRHLDLDVSNKIIKFDKAIDIVNKFMKISMMLQYTCFQATNTRLRKV